jgi:AbrB family looped-hinge helix DNA binding protein
MKITIDSAGRIVVPKVLRQALNIKPGQTLDIRGREGRIEIEITATPMALKKRVKDPVLMPPPSVIFSVPRAGGLPGSARSQTAKTRSRRRTWDASTRRGCCGLH